MASRMDQDPSAASAAFGRRLRELRNRQGLSQDALSDASAIHSPTRWAWNLGS